jgi:hypothetical protein
LFRPPFLIKPSVKDLTGRPFHSSERSIRTNPRWPGVVGLYDFNAIFLSSVFWLASENLNQAGYAYSLSESSRLFIKHKFLKICNLTAYIKGLY